MDVSERDGTPEARRVDGAGQAANLAPAGLQPHSRQQRSFAGGTHHADQPLRHSPVAAVQDADDDLLADVAPLGQADCAILDARFERNRRRIHVAAEGRTSGFDTSNVRRRAIDVLRSGLDGRVELVEMDCNVNDPEFAEAMADKLDEYMKS